MPSVSGLAQSMEKMLSGVGDKVIELSRDKWYKLVFSILIDIIGIMTYLIPLLAELMDVFWAPLSALLIFPPPPAPLPSYSRP
ncbi:hypothetical protein T484DRAFT_1765008 [Baffinella frigidus]|nr:hypothetical protein T484DRAFT_1765008 [Cryptophyta sp. CCMP2293]